MKSAKEDTIYPGVDTIRRVQELMVLCMLLPPDGKLREVLEKALALHEEPLLARTARPAGLHPFEVKAWLESLWIHGDLSPEGRELVAWQNVGDNMNAALHELQDAEERTGLVLIAQELQKDLHHLNAGQGRVVQPSE
ncbi:DurN family substrate-assisted peptide maturase [Streptomyces roseoverticillatus]|uniref:DurN family substrate-assisted peptide maturase n=1 Tax=Streptomyces roseoverticillatus TaxID=66429 RepID=UPI0004C2A444|nr:DurN family substrate-assisted peptide maturase [Streptomyces roseoverticillatus]